MHLRTVVRAAVVVCAAASLLTGMVLVVAPSDALASGRWRAHVVRYVDRSRSRWDVRTAVVLWNRSQTGVRLVPARRGQRAQIHIYSSRCPKHFGGSTRPPCGFYPPDGRVYLDTGEDSFGESDGLQFATHELGHALGLDHVGSCSIMVENFAFEACRGRMSPPCGPTAADARRLVHLYGGRVHRHSNPSCFYFLSSPPPPKGTLIAPAQPMTAPPRRNSDLPPDPISLQVRNDSTWTWGRTRWGPVAIDDVEILTVDDAGHPVKLPDNCNSQYGGSIGDMPRSATNAVRPGQSGTFLLRLCPPPYEETIHLRLFDVAANGTPGHASSGQLTVRVRGDSDTQSPPP